METMGICLHNLIILHGFHCQFEHCFNMLHSLVHLKTMPNHDVKLMGNHCKHFVTVKRLFLCLAPASLFFKALWPDSGPFDPLPAWRHVVWHLRSQPERAQSAHQTQNMSATDTQAVSEGDAYYYYYYY